MARFALVRLLQFLPMLWAVATALFVLLHLAPGGPVVALAGEFATADTVAQIEARFGLDRPLIVQYATFLANLAAGDLGTSYVHKRAVLDVVLAHLPATLILVVPAIVFAAILGVPARHPRGATRRLGAGDGPVRARGLRGAGVLARPPPAHGALGRAGPPADPGHGQPAPAGHGPRPCARTSRGTPPCPG